VIRFLKSFVPPSSLGDRGGVIDFMTELQSQTPQGQITELQSLRGIAAVTVMIGHCLISYGPSPLLVGLSGLFNGRAAVVVFFVLSGYVLTRSLHKGQFDGAAVLAFYVRRGFRLYPAIWVASAFGLAYLFALHWQIPPDRAGPVIQHAFRPDRFDTLHIVTSLAGMTTFIIPQLWTIVIEIVASIAMPGIAFVALYRRQWFACTFGLALLVSFIIPNTYYHITLYLIDFVVGAGLAIPGLAVRLFRNAPARLFVGIGLVMLACTRLLPLDYWNPAANLLELAVATLIIGTLTGANEKLYLFRARFLGFLGDISYGIYLLHFVVLCTVVKAFTLLQWAWGAGVDIYALAILATCVTSTVTILLAWLSYVYVELPGIELGRRLLRFLGRPRGIGPGMPGTAVP
jgi:peptidoglycan/LPS O-acetylase OafA/YrhL